METKPASTPAKPDTKKDATKIEPFTQAQKIAKLEKEIKGATVSNAVADMSPRMAGVRIKKAATYARKQLMVAVKKCQVAYLKSAGIEQYKAIAGEIQDTFNEVDKSLEPLYPSEN